jgi:hypothetical protein
VLIKCSAAGLSRREYLLRKKKGMIHDLGQKQRSNLLSDNKDLIHDLRRKQRHPCHGRRSVWKTPAKPGTLL